MQILSADHIPMEFPVVIFDKRDGSKRFCSAALSRGAMGWSAVCDCSIS